ncbi:iron ABC transporter permease [Chelativorans sp. Marseille-P2723]|uniref:FecCD family ABC transporter permease n=1 Tax=Chelativorans sp. Marseille-P2723 TaxID=2709133 RepID=UPI00156F530B|nr:iron ABC transporter permease [Chelativorans sp. Marseille-P2723]
MERGGRIFSSFHRQARTEGDRSIRARLVIAVLLLMLPVAFLFSLSAGASDASLVALLRSIFAGEALAATDTIIIYDIRLPRVAMGALVGASLALSGAVMQGLFRNPLADPGVVGVSSGAALGAVTIIVLGDTFLAPFIEPLGSYALPLAAFAGALATTATLYRLATRKGRTSVATMLLAGIAIAAMAGAFTGLLIFIADDQQLRELTFWGLGSLAGATWVKLGAIGPTVAAALCAAPFLAKGLNALALGEAVAGHLGVSVQRFKHVAIIAVAAATGAVVAVSGGIGFVGIVAPHLLRLLIGPDHRYLLPASALLGAVLLLLADTAARTVVAPAELPIGIVTAAVGAPFFLWMLLRIRGIVDL